MWFFVQHYYINNSGIKNPKTTENEKQKQKINAIELEQKMN